MVDHPPLVTASSRGPDHQAPLSFRGKSQTGAYVFTRELGEIRKYLLLAHSPSEISQHVADGNTRAANRRFAETDFRIEDDTPLVFHNPTLRLGLTVVKAGIREQAKLTAVASSLVC